MLLFVAILLIIQMRIYLIIALTAQSDTSNNVLQAHTLGEVGILALLRVYSGTNLPIFIRIGSHLTDKEQKISWLGTVFF